MTCTNTAEIKLHLPEAVLDFVDYLADMAGGTREEWLQEAIRSMIRDDVGDPLSNWNEKRMKERFGLKAYLDGGREDGSD